MILYTLYFILGLCVGSFLNAVIWRLETGESIIWSDTRKGVKCVKNNSLTAVSPSSRLARSYCPHCQTTLKWHDLIPVFSFLFLRGKCRYCEEEISTQYPAVEIGTGVIFLLISNFAGAGTELVSSRITNQFLMAEFLNGHWTLVIGHFFSLVFWLYIVSVLIVIFVYDLKHYIIPDKILFPAIAISIMYHVASIMQNHTSYIIHHTLYNYLGSAIIASGFFLSLVLVSRGKWMGLGDVKLAFLMGLILGWPNIFIALLFAFFSGALVGLALVLISGSPASSGSRTSKYWNYSLKSQIPFGPFLIIGTFIALFWGNRIMEWYLAFLF